MQKVKEKKESAQLLSFDNLINKDVNFSVGEIKQKDYQNGGLYPVVDQGMQHIAGYSDEKEKVYSGPLPVVVFGDHTRVVKFVNFPFVVGGSGVKILISSKEVLQKYLYYLLLNTNIENKGYNRHYNLLKEKKFLTPSIKKQQKIVEILDAAQEAVEAQDKLIQKAQELKQATMHRLFTEGVRGEKQKKIPRLDSGQAKIGKIPEGWEIKKIKDFGQVITGSTPSTKIPEYYGGGYKLISPADLDNGIYVKTAHNTLTEEGIKMSRQLPKNTVLVGCIGNVGKLGMTIDEISATNQQINAVISNQSNDSHFLLYLFLFYKDIFAQNARQTTVPILNKSSFEKIELAAPKLGEQKEIASILQTIDEKIEIHKKKKEKHEELFQSLLYNLMS